MDERGGDGRQPEGAGRVANAKVIERLPANGEWSVLISTINELIDRENARNAPLTPAAWDEQMR